MMLEIPIYLSSKKPAGKKQGAVVYNSKAAMSSPSKITPNEPMLEQQIRIITTGREMLLQYDIVSELPLR